MKCSIHLLLPVAAVIALIGSPHFTSAQSSPEETVTSSELTTNAVTEANISDETVDFMQSIPTPISSTEPATTTTTQEATTSRPATTTTAKTTTTRKPTTTTTTTRKPTTTTTTTRKPTTTTTKTTTPPPSTSPSTRSTPSTKSPPTAKSGLGHLGFKCVTASDCRKNKNFQCVDGTCGCEKPQVFDLRQQKCVIPLGKECDSDLSDEESLCPEFAECFLDRCVCKTGYSMHTLTKCKSDVLERKTVLWPRQPKQDNSDKSSCTPSSCDESKGLKCQPGGACKCKDSKEIFLEEFGRCLNTSMQRTLKDALSLVKSSELDLNSFVKLLEKFEESDQVTQASDHYNSPVHQLINLLGNEKERSTSRSQIAPYSSVNYGSDEYAAAAQEPVTETALPGDEGGGASHSSNHQQMFPIDPESAHEESLEPLTFSRESGESMKKPTPSEQPRSYLPLDNYVPQSQEPAIVQRQAPGYGHGGYHDHGGYGHPEHGEGIPLHGYGVIPESTNLFGRQGGGGQQQDHGLGHDFGTGLRHAVPFGIQHGLRHGLGHEGFGREGRQNGPIHHPHGLSTLGHGLGSGLGHGLGHGIGHHLGHGLGHGLHGLGFGNNHGHGGGPGGGGGHGGGHGGGGGFGGGGGGFGGGGGGGHGGPPGGGHHDHHHHHPPPPHHHGPPPPPPHHHGPPPPPPPPPHHHHHHPKGILGEVAEFVGRSLKLVDRFLPLAHALNEALKKHGGGLGGGGLGGGHGGGGFGGPGGGGPRGHRDVEGAQTVDLLKEGGPLSGFTKFVGVLMRLRERLEQSGNGPLKKLLLGGPST